MPAPHCPHGLGVLAWAQRGAAGVSASSPADGAAPCGPCFARRPRARISGFSLLEVLVAFIIVAVVATALFRLFGGALGNASAADEWTRALLVAQNRLVLAAALPLREATDAGTEADGRIAWRTAITPYLPPDPNPDHERASEAMPTRLYRVTVDVQFPGIAGQPRTLSLSTLRLGERNPA